MEVVNQGRVNYDYQKGENQPIIRESRGSNRVITTVLENRIEITKTVSKKVAEVFEVITYKIIIKNITRLTIEKLFIQDELPCCVRFIKNSLKVGGTIKRCIEPNEGIIINELEPEASIVVEFKVVVLPRCSGCLIVNQASIIYSYLYNIEKPPLYVTKTTNKVDTLILNNLFTMVMLHEDIEKPKQCPCIHKITKKEVDVQRINIKIIEGIEGPYVLIIGRVVYYIEYSTWRNCYPSCLTKVSGFSCKIKVPKGIRFCDVNNIRFFIEQYTVRILNCGAVATDTYLQVRLV